MCRTYERGTKARLSFSGGPRVPVNMADSMELLNVGGKKPHRKWHVYCAVLRYILNNKFSQFLEVLWDFHCLWIQKQSNYWRSPYYPPVYRRAWPTREAKPRFGATFKRSAHVCETHLLNSSGFMFYWFNEIC